MERQHEITESQSNHRFDVGDKRHRFCVLDSHAEVLKESLLFNERNELAKLAGTYPGALVVMEEEPVRVDQPIS